MDKQVSKITYKRIIDYIMKIIVMKRAIKRIRINDNP